MNNTTRHWDKFYENTDRRISIPSQFAAFVASEYVDIADTILDLGCGNGRDSNYFSSIGFKVLGVDASSAAIHRATSLSGAGAVFIHSSIENPELAENLKRQVKGADSIVVYSRFFLHAIPEYLEESFWNLIKDLSGLEAIALEFRSHKDKALKKETAVHFRRFINPVDLIVRANLHGFLCDYFSEGFGMAKYKDDDAHVARMLLTRK